MLCKILFRTKTEEERETLLNGTYERFPDAVTAEYLLDGDRGCFRADSRSFTMMREGEVELRCQFRPGETTVMNTRLGGMGGSIPVTTRFYRLHFGAGGAKIELEYELSETVIFLGIEILRGEVNGGSPKYRRTRGKSSRSRGGPR